MWRTQLIDSETLLFKFGHPENITARVNKELKSIPIEFFQPEYGRTNNNSILVLCYLLSYNNKGIGYL